jgi:hypothetical protein
MSAALAYSESLRTDLIVLKVHPMLKSARAWKQYFAVNPDRLRFIRAEDGLGKVLARIHDGPTESKGLMPEANTADEWIELLQSKDKSDVLSALVFIGSEHDSDAKDPAMVDELRNNTRIRALVERLRESDNEWIRQAAELAARH